MPVFDSDSSEGDAAPPPQDTSSPIAISSGAGPSEESEGDVAVVPRPARALPPRSADDDEDNSVHIPYAINNISDEDSDVIITSSFRKRKATLSQSINLAHGGEVENDSGVTTLTSRTSMSKRPKTEAEQDLADDIDFLGSSGMIHDDFPPALIDNSLDPNLPRSSRRDPGSSQKSVKQKALEALKRKRSKQAAARTGSTQAQPPQLTTSDNVSDSSEDNTSESDASEPAIDYSAFHKDEYDEDFVEDDGGVKVQLPFAFSQYKTMKLSQLFKYAVEWMVCKHLNNGICV